MRLAGAVVLDQVGGERLGHLLRAPSAGLADMDAVCTDIPGGHAGRSWHCPSGEGRLACLAK